MLHTFILNRSMSVFFQDKQLYQYEHFFQIDPFHFMEISNFRLNIPCNVLDTNTLAQYFIQLSQLILASALIATIQNSRKRISLDKCRN